MASGQADAVPTREKEVISAFRHLSQTIESLEATTGTLLERIAPVLSLEPPTAISNDKKVNQGHSAKVATEIVGLAERIERVTQSIGSAGRRVEV